MPGSPPSRMTPPGTNPLPRIPSSPHSCELTRSSSRVGSSRRSTGRFRGRSRMADAGLGENRLQRVPGLTFGTLPLPARADGLAGRTGVGGLCFHKGNKKGRLSPAFVGQKCCYCCGTLEWITSSPNSSTVSGVWKNTAMNGTDAPAEYWCCWSGCRPWPSGPLRCRRGSRPAAGTGRPRCRT
jgi:hypothetical protein